ncbi:MAG TPA: OmpA family protein [Acidobacteriota bacterium]|nr:OmpA family protein [Acidobacteriota bacterium]
MRKLLMLFLLLPLVFLTTNIQAQEETSDTAIVTSKDSGYSSLFFQEEDTVDVSTGGGGDHYLWFIDGYGGKERMVRDEFPGGRCAGLVGVKGGVTPLLSDNLELEAAFGGKINVRDDEFSSVFGDVALNGLFGAGFVGAGVSFWDLTEDDTRTVALLAHFGFDLVESGKIQIVGEGRIPFDQFDDTGNNYMVWGGLRFRFGPSGGGEAVPPPPSAPPAPPTPPPAPSAPPGPAAPAEPEFVWPEVYFPFDQYILTAEAREKIDSVAKYMTDNPNSNVTIEGHCCYIGTDEYNLALGQQRADAIRDYLVGKGIATARLKTVSYGEARPKYDNSKEITRRFNRRGFFVVIRPQ